MENYQSSKEKNECDPDHFEGNQCRLEGEFYKITDVCMAPSEENIKREIVKKGPVVA